MKHIKNDIASFHYSGELLPQIQKFCLLSQEYPFILEPAKGCNDKAKEIFRREGFELRRTVKKTTLLYNEGIDSFFKVLHPLTLSKKALFNLSDRVRHLYGMSSSLRKREIKVPAILAYGKFRKHNSQFFVMNRVAGRSLHNILIRNKGRLPVETYQKVMAEVARIHVTGYWLGDAHPSHIYINEGEVSGFIDIDSIRVNPLSMLKYAAKDIAGLSHPQLPVTEDELNGLVRYYLKLSGIRNNEKFFRLLKLYRERRWKGQV